MMGLMTPIVAPKLYTPPKIIGSAATTTGNVVTALNCDLPSGIVAGERLFLVVSGQATASRTITGPAGWTTLYNEAGTNNTRPVAVFTKIATGGEGSTAAISISNNTNIATIAFRVAGGVANCEVSTRTSGASANPPVAAFTPSARAKLWLAVLHRGSGTTGTQPSGYTSFSSIAQGGNTASAVAYKEEDATGQSSDSWASGSSTASTTSVIAIW